LPSNQIRSHARGRKTSSVGVIVLVFISAATQMVALSAVSAPASEIAREKAIMAAALLAGIGCRANQAACQPKPPANALARTQVIEHMALPAVAATSPLVHSTLGKMPGMVTVDIQARSAAVKPVEPKALLWGVDSCKAFTSDPAGSSGLYPQVVAGLGAPDFWGRYLTTTYNCPALSATEIAAAHAHHMGILPIYNDFDCSAVNGYQTAGGYAKAAADAAAADGIPLGTGIVIDIEPAGPYCPGAGGVDPLFVQGWFDGLTQRNYVPIFYANSTAYQAFAQAYCAAVGAHPQIARSWLWSFEPSLLGNYAKGSAPWFSPKNIGCPAQHAAWQYRLSAGGTPEVDQDEALSQLPIWYP
jgi:hypothetical protein